MIGKKVNEKGILKEYIGCIKRCAKKVKYNNILKIYFFYPIYVVIFKVKQSHDIVIYFDYLLLSI